MIMEQRLTIIGLGVKNLAVSTQFYTEILGWKKTEASNENITFIQMNGLLLSFYDRDKLAEDAEVSANGSGFKAFSLAYNTRTKEEVNEVFRMLKSKGVTVVKDPEEVFWGGYSGYFYDPDNNLWEVAFNPFLTLDSNGSVPH